MKWLWCVLGLPLLAAMPALAQQHAADDDDDAVPAAPSSRRVIHSSTPDPADDDLLPKSKPAAAPKPLPGPVRQVSPPIGSEANDDLLAPGPVIKPIPPHAKGTAKPAPPPKAKPKSAKELKREAEEAKQEAKREKEREQEEAKREKARQQQEAKAKAASAKASARTKATSASSPKPAPLVAPDDDEPRGSSKVVRHSQISDDESDDLAPAPPKPAPAKPAPPKPAPRKKVTADVPRAKRAPAADAFAFDLLPEEAHISSDEQVRLEAQVSTRRSMLEWHQALGIGTAALMVGTVIFGQLNFSDKFGGNGNTGQFEIWHSGFEAATVVAFLGAGAMALFAPVPYEKRSSGVDTVTVHKYSMLVATIGMATEVPLGIVTVAREGYADQAALAVIHLVIGYITAAALGTGATALFF